MFEVSFSHASSKVEFFPWRRLNSFFFLVSAILTSVQWFVWTLYRVWFVLSFCFFVCFSSDGQGWMRWYSCLLMIGFVFLFCLLFRWGVLHRVLLVVGWCWVLYSGGFLCVSSHYLIPPRVSSLVLYSLKSQCSHSKGSGLHLCSLSTISLDFSKTQPRQIRINVLVIKLGRRVPLSWS